MTSNTPTPDYAMIAYDRDEITNALHRYAFGIDHADRDSLASAFTADAVLDSTPMARKIGLASRPMNSRDEILAMVLPAFGPLDTSHTVSNPQITLDGDSATLQAYVLAQHFLPGEGPRPECTRHALFMNRCSAELVRDGKMWRMRRLVIDNAWFDGDLTVVTAPAAPGR